MCSGPEEPFDVFALMPGEDRLAQSRDGMKTEPRRWPAAQERLRSWQRRRQRLHQHQASYTLGRSHGQQERGGYGGIQSNERSIRYGEPVEQTGDVVRDGRGVVPGLWSCAVAQAAEVGSEHGVLLG
jgi:hypothetical protein